jgi:hypothetical protein
MIIRDWFDPLDPHWKHARQLIEKSIGETCLHLGIVDPGRIKELSSVAASVFLRRLELAQPGTCEVFLKTLIRTLEPRDCGSQENTLALAASGPWTSSQSAASSEPPDVVKGIVDGLLWEHPQEARWWVGHYREGKPLQQIAEETGAGFLNVWRGIRRFHEELQNRRGDPDCAQDSAD